MSDINPNYPVMEIAVSLISYSPLESGHERIIEGDIVAIRRPNIGVGIQEAINFLWLRIEGLEESEFYRLTDSITTSASDFDKRRYCIPLEKLEEIDNEFDVDLALISDLIYQPFLTLDEDDYTFILEDGHLPLQVSGLVFDKVTGEYL